jgi:hypothetical protein
VSATRRRAALIFFGCLLLALAAPTASADPYVPGPVIPMPVPSGADPICNAPGLPPCAAPAPFTLTPAQGCAVIAWRTHVFCNWWPGIQVPTGTPGSVG